jgi:hypothetical protein
MLTPFQNDTVTPRWEVKIRIRVNAGALTWLGEQGFKDLRNGFHPANREYKDLRRITWKTAKEVLQAEREIFDEALSTATTPREFMDLIYDLANDNDFSGYFPRLSQLDTGIMSSVAALSASGCTPFESCAGGMAHPHVDFYVPEVGQEAYLDALKKSARAASAGLINADEGRLEVFGDHILKLWRFAEYYCEIAQSHGLKNTPTRRKPI